MSTSPTRFIQVTNDNPLIKYEPGGSAWSSVPKTSNMFQIGTMGSPISSFLKTTKNGMISFNFEGFDIVVVVSYIPPSSGTKSGSNPIVNCQVDGKLVGTNIPQSAQNNWPICDSGNLSDGEHTLVVDIPDPAGSIFFDYILYAPSPNSQPDLTDVSVRIEANDPSISYSGGFVIESDTGSAQLTNAGNAFINVSFNGQQLTWYGVYSTFLPFVPSTAKYSIDGGSPIQFPLSGLTDDGSNTTALLNQILFQTAVLPQGSHKLTATYLGNGEHTALGLAFVVVQNGSSSNITPTSVGPNGPDNIPTTTSQSTSTKSHDNKNVIIGVVVGVVAFLFLAIAIFFLRRHIKRTLKKEMMKSRDLSESDPIDHVKMNSSEFLNRNSNPLQATQEPTSAPVRLTQSVTSSESLYNVPTLIIPPIIPNQTQSPNSARTSTLAQSIDTLETSSLISGVQSPYTPTPVPFQLPTLPTLSVFEPEQQQHQITVESSLLQTPQTVGAQLHNNRDVTDVAASTTSAASLDPPSNHHTDNDRQLLRHNPPVPPEVNLGSGAERSFGVDAPRQTTEMPPALPSNSIAASAPLTVVNEEAHADSGVRLGRQQTLSYGALSLSSILSKDGLPPMYTSR